MGTRPERQRKAAAEPGIYFNQHNPAFRADERLNIQRPVGAGEMLNYATRKIHQTSMFDRRALADLTATHLHAKVRHSTDTLTAPVHEQVHGVLLPNRW